MGGGTKGEGKLETGIIEFSLDSGIFIIILRSTDQFINVKLTSVSIKSKNQITRGGNRFISAANRSLKNKKKNR